MPCAGSFPRANGTTWCWSIWPTTDYPVGINPLDMAGRDRDKAVDTLITIAEHLWEASYGSRTENVLEYALKTLADANELFIQTDPYLGPDRQYTLLGVVPLLRTCELSPQRAGAGTRQPAA